MNGQQLAKGSLHHIVTLIVYNNILKGA